MDTNSESLYGGTTTSFLFSLTHDCKLPYHGRVKGPKQEGDPDEDEAPKDDFGFDDSVSRANRSDDGRSRGDRSEGVDFRSRMSDDDNMGGGGGDDDDSFARGSRAMDGDSQGPSARPKVPAKYRNLRHDCLWSSKDQLQFGLKDLILKGDLSECSSHLEHSYGVGLNRDSEEAKVWVALVGGGGGGGGVAPCVRV